MRRKLHRTFRCRGNATFQWVNVRSGNGPEFIANAVQQWLSRTGVKTLYISPGSPWENGCCESFNRSMRNELLNGEIL